MISISKLGIVFGAALLSAAYSKELSIRSTVKLNNGVEMPVFGLGTWRSDPGKVKEAVEHALKNGYIHVDCAAVYQNQEEVGEGIKAAIDAGAVTRKDIFVVSKLWNHNFRPEFVRKACLQTLKELGLDYLDQYLMHWPTPFKRRTVSEESCDENGTCKEGDEERLVFFPEDVNGDIETDEDLDLMETWREMEKLVKDGLVRSIGISNFNIEETKHILDNCEIKPAVNQIELHPYFPQEELSEYSRANGIEIVAYSPLGNISPEDPNQLTPLSDPYVLELASKYNKSPAQICIRYSLQLGNVCIPKTVTPKRILENSDVFDFAIEDGEVQKLLEAGRKLGPKGRLVNPKFRPNGAHAFPIEG